jgi:hypothetical protein
MRRLLPAIVLLGLVPAPAEALAGTVSVPDGETAVTPLDFGHPRRSDAAPDLEIVDRAQCVVRKSALERRVLGPMQSSAESRLSANDPTIGKAHIRWIVSSLPDAGGTVRHIGPMARTYAGSPFWRHPVKVSVQVVANATVVKQMSRTVRERCDPGDSTALQALTELTDGLCHTPEVREQYAVAFCSDAE